MMDKPKYQIKCPCGKSIFHLIEDKTKMLVCPICNQRAIQLRYINNKGTMKYGIKLD